ncbi:MAG: hypothetical protein NTU89_00820, partial [Candidatus Dependentiae bacterium]|nr:hypothetical protein [Candidatus Dependentiae bacterium]
LDRKDIGRDSRSKLEAFQAKMDTLYNLLKANHISTVPESILKELEKELDSIEQSINNKSISSTSVGSKPTLSSVTRKSSMSEEENRNLKVGFDEKAI